jgi:hypothetical protein
MILLTLDWLFELSVDGRIVREGCFQIIAKKRHAEEIFGRAPVVRLCRPCANHRVTG